MRKNVKALKRRKTKRKKNYRAEKAKKNQKRGLFNKNMLKAVVVLSVMGCIALIFTTESDSAKKKTEILVLQAEVDAYKAENEDLERILRSDDISEYMEKIALEEYGYAYPDERRFYETSRD